MGSRPGAAGAIEEPPGLESDAGSSIGRRLGGMSLWMLLALGAAVARMCGDGG